MSTCREKNKKVFEILYEIFPRNYAIRDGVATLAQYAVDKIKKLQRDYDEIWEVYKKEVEEP